MKAVAENPPQPPEQLSVASALGSLTLNISWGAGMHHRHKQLWVLQAWEHTWKKPLLAAWTWHCPVYV